MDVFFLDLSMSQCLPTTIKSSKEQRHKHRYLEIDTV
jgi:hypothetical protein